MKEERISKENDQLSLHSSSRLFPARFHDIDRLIFTIQIEIRRGTFDMQINEKKIEQRKKCNVNVILNTGRR